KGLISERLRLRSREFRFGGLQRTAGPRRFAAACEDPCVSWPALKTADGFDESEGRDGSRPVLALDLDARNGFRVQFPGAGGETVRVEKEGQQIEIHAVAQIRAIGRHGPDAGEQGVQA